MGMFEVMGVGVTVWGQDSPNWEGSSQDEVVLEEEVVEVLLKLEEHMLHVDLHNHSNLVLVVD